jgi:hypothetical protein
MRRLSTWRSRHHGNHRPGGAAHSLRAAHPHRSSWCHGGPQRQRQHDDAPGPPGRHVFDARDPGASAGDESSLGSLDALPPANLHGYAEWDFSSAPDPVMFRRFLDATDYWFGCSNNSSTGSYDPARECCVVIANDPANATGAVGAGDGAVTPAPGIAPHLAAGPSTPAGADADAQLAQARELEAKLAEEYRTVRLLRASMASLRARRTRARAGQTGPRPHQRRL